MSRFHTMLLAGFALAATFAVLRSAPFAEESAARASSTPKSPPAESAEEKSSEQKATEQQSPKEESPEDESAEQKAPGAKAQPKAAKLTPLNRNRTVFLDKANNRLLLKSEIVLQEGILEMFLCRKNSKEHESIVSLDSQAYIVHTGLLALGAKPGGPAQFDPKYVPPKGQELKIFVTWTDKKGKNQRVDARSWMRYVTNKYFAHEMKELPADLKLPDETRSPMRYDSRTKELLWFGRMTKKQRDELLKRSADKRYHTAIEDLYKRTQFREMDAKFVFAGSGFIVDRETKKRRYLAEAGFVICVANFPGATIDVTAKSSADKGNELFEAWTERIPPLETEVTVELIPVFPKEAEKKPAADDESR